MFNLIAHKINAEYSDYYNAYLFIETNTKQRSKVMIFHVSILKSPRIILMCLIGIISKFLNTKQYNESASYPKYSFFNA